MRELINRYGTAAKTVEGVEGTEMLRVAPYAANCSLLVASRYTTGERRHVNTFVTTPEAVMALYGADGWVSPVPQASAAAPVALAAA